MSEKNAKRVLSRAAGARRLHERGLENYSEPRSPTGIGVRPKAVYDPFKPPASLLVKIGSIAVHVEEAIAPGGHEFDWAAIKGLLADPEVVEWRAAMDKLGFMPRKRS